MVHPRATVGDGCRIAYRLDGGEGRPVLVLSNSLGTNVDLWAPQVEPFAARFRLLRYDSRGHGASDAPPGAYSLDRLGRDVVELLDALRLERVHFCGLSIGGMVGQWLGVFAPDRIDRLVLSNTAAYMGPPGGWQQRIETVLRDGMEAIADAVLERWFTPAFRARSPEVPARMRAALVATDPIGYAGCCAAIRDADLRPLSQLIAPKTLLIAGAADPTTTTAQARAIASALRASEGVVEVDAAHLANVGQPEAFATAVSGFLA